MRESQARLEPGFWQREKKGSEATRRNPRHRSRWDFDRSLTPGAGRSVTRKAPAAYRRGLPGWEDGLRIVASLRAILERFKTMRHGSVGQPRPQGGGFLSVPTPEMGRSDAIVSGTRGRRWMAGSNGFVPLS